MNPLKAGDIAPKFSLPDQDGEQVNLTDFQGQRVLVYFYPKAMTPGCTVQACGLRDNMDELKKAGVDVLGISTDKPEKLSRFAEKELLNFTLLRRCAELAERTRLITLLHSVLAALAASIPHFS